MRRSRLGIVALITCAWVLLVPASGHSASHAGHIDLADGLTLMQQFGYAPEFRQNVVTFDARNVPAIRSRGASQDDTSFVHRLEAGAWVRRDMLQALRDAYPDYAGTVNAGGFASDRIDFDVDGRAYTVLTVRIDDEGTFRNVLLASADGCATWSVVELPFGNDTPLLDQEARGNMTAEHDAGDLLQGPPLIAVWRQTAPWKGEWASLNEMYVVQPVWSGDRLELQPPVLVSERALGMTLAAGGASFAVTSGDRTHFVYNTVTPLGTLRTPTYAATYDHVTNTVGPSTRVAASRPANNCHSTPGICMDSLGTLHVVTGALGWPFRYSRSVAPLTTTSWTPAQDVLTSGYRTRTTDADGRGSQTYLSLVCDPDDTLHVVFRQRRRNVDARFADQAYLALAHQSLAPGAAAWTQPDLIVVPPLPGYSQYYQKLTVDRLGRLFVSCSYFSRRDPPATRRFRRFHHRMVLISEDGGRNWRFATTADFVAGTLPW